MIMDCEVGGAKTTVCGWGDPFVSMIVCEFLWSL